MFLKNSVSLIGKIALCLCFGELSGGVDFCHGCKEFESDHLSRFPLTGSDALESLACKSAFEGHERVLHFLVQEGCFLENAHFSFERNPFLCAAINGHLKVFKFLLAEACPRGFWFPDQETLNLCCLCAAGGGHLEVFKFISFEVFPRSSWILTEETLNRCCILSAACGHLHVLKFLFKEVFRHCSFTRIPEPDVIERCFFAATQHGHLDVLEFLVKKAPQHCSLILEGTCSKHPSNLIFGGP
jgi:hypothetical protein